MLVNMPVLSLVLFVGSLSQGGARSRGFALGYCRSGFQPFGSEPSRVGCGSVLTADRGAFGFGMEENNGVREDAHSPGLGNLAIAECGMRNAELGNGEAGMGGNVLRSRRPVLRSSTAEGRRKRRGSGNMEYPIAG